MGGPPIVNSRYGDQLVNMAYEAGMVPGGPMYSNPDASLYIAGLPGGCASEHLYRMFSAFGAIARVHAKQGADNSGRNFSIGFVHFFDPAAAQSAIQAFNGLQMPNGMQLKVVVKTTKT